MKTALILHGTDGSPELIWIPWLKAKLEEKGYSVWAPLLPNNHYPNRETYGKFLLEENAEGHDLTDAIIIGHSSGAVETLNLLDDERTPHLKLAVMVGAWAGGKPNGYDTNEQFEHLFPENGFQFNTMRQKADHIAFLHGDDDPWCPLEQAQFLAKSLDVPITVVPNGAHLGKNKPELPELWQIIESHI
jgi:predicted alpha/beta hydrolase family esterase